MPKFGSKCFGQCPFCGEFPDHNLGCEIDDEYVHYDFKCPQCEAEWTDHMSLRFSGFTYKDREYDEEGDEMYEYDTPEEED